MNYKQTLFFLLLSLLCSLVILNSAFAGNVDQSQIKQFLPNTQARASEVNSNLETLRQAVNDNNAMMNQANTHINTLDSDINGLSTNIEELGSDINDINMDINNHKSHTDAHHSRYTDLEAVEAVKASGIGVVTNNSISTNFISSFNEQEISIPDGDPVGAASTITIPDIGVINSIDINVEINTSDISRLDIKLIDPNNNTYILYESNDWATGTHLTGSWPDPNEILDGDITIWIDNNPKGDWKLWVIDNKDDNLENDGEITEWGITIEGFSVDSVMVNANLTVKGSIRANGGGSVITPSKMLLSRVQNTIFFTAADGSQHTLDISNQTRSVGNTHIYYYPNCTENNCRSGNNNNESVLYLNIDSSPSMCCSLFSSEDDYSSASKGLYWATDNGNNSSDAWGNPTTSTFKLSRNGVSDAIPMVNFSSYAIICF